MFGLGSREAVMAALGAEDVGPLRGFGAPAPPTEVSAAIDDLLPGLALDLRPHRVEVRLPDDPFEAGRAATVVHAVLLAHGWRAAETTHRHVVGVADL